MNTEYENKIRDFCKTHSIKAPDRNRLLSLIRDISYESGRNKARRLLERGIVNFNLLSPKEALVLTLREIEGKTLEETGREFGVTRERIRMIEAKAVDKIRWFNEKRDVVMDSSGRIVLSSVLKTNIAHLNFSARTYNALSNVNIRTFGGLLRKTEDELKNIEGLSEAGMREIKYALNENGFSLKK